jgi:hypothetical protein
MPTPATLSHFPFKATGDQVKLTDLLEVVECAAASRPSIHQACHDLEGVPSAVTMPGQ